MSRPLNTERSLISAVLRSGDVGSVVRQGITSQMFSRFPREWEWIERHYARHRKAPEKLAFKQTFPDFRIMRVDDPETFIDPLRTAYARDALISVMDEATDQLDRGMDPVALLARVESSVRGISTTASSECSVNILEDWTGTWEDVAGRAERKEQHGYTGIPTGFTTLDKHTGGVQPGELWIAGARLGQGKTWFLTKIAVMGMHAGYGVHVESLEQPRVQIAMRLHTFMSNGQFHHNALAGGTVDLDAYKEYLSGLSGQNTGSLHITDATRGRATVSTIAAHVERNRPDLVIVDYITLIRSQGGKDWQAMAELSADLKSVATQYKVGIVAAAQLNREFGTRGLPGPEALAQSDSFGQDADVVITMRRNRDSQRVMDMVLSKNRHGEDGMSWTAEFDPNHGVFHEVNATRAQELIDGEDDAA